MGWMGTTKGFRYKLQDIQLRHILHTAKKVGLLQEVKVFLDEIEALMSKALSLTEVVAKEKGIDMEITSTILDETNEATKRLQRSYNTLIPQ
jgi:hypothetical protein